MNNNLNNLIAFILNIYELAILATISIILNARLQQFIVIQLFWQQYRNMKVKINKLIPYTQQNKKFKTATVKVEDKLFYISPNPIEQKNYVGNPIQLHFICSFPDNNSDYEYLKSDVRVENTEYKEVVEKRSVTYKDIKRGGANEAKRQFLFDFIPPYRGGYTLVLDLAYKQRYFIQTTQPPQEKRESMRANLICEDPFQVEQNVIYEEKPSSISFPMFIQYIITNKLKETPLELDMMFASEYFDHRFLNNTKSIRVDGGQIFYAMLEVQQKNDNKKEALFGDKGLMIGTLWIAQGKSKFEKKLFLKQGYKHVLFKAETIDKKVVKKDIVEVKIKFINIYQFDYALSEIRIGINESQIPPGIKILKISKDHINLNKKGEQIVTLTMICLRSGLFQLKGISLNVKDSKNTLEQRNLKYINELTLIVQNQKEDKKDVVMEKTVEIEIDSLI